MTDGYRLLLAYPGTDYFANVKVERSAAEEYVSDKAAIVASLEQIASSAASKEAKVVRRRVRRFDIVSLDNSSLDVNGPISMHVLFNDATQTVATVYFLNQRAERRRFQTFAEYTALRDAFLEDYTKCLDATTQ
jgi:hypothetical protein